MMTMLVTEALKYAACRNRITNTDNGNDDDDDDDDDEDADNVDDDDAVENDCDFHTGGVAFPS